METTITTTSINRHATPYQGGKAFTKRGLTRTALCIIGLITTMLPLPALAVSITLQPTDLNPGDTYHLAFVTSTDRDAKSTDIDTYNDFVQAVADNASTNLGIPIGAADGFTWKVIASTATVDARDNIGVITSPIYNLHDQRIADDEADLFDGNLFNPLNITELGGTAPFFVWTGTAGTGVQDFGLGTVNPTRGFNLVPVSGLWLKLGPNPRANPFPFYGISSEVTVPGGVSPFGPPPVVLSSLPEPATVVLLSTGLLGLLGYRQLRRKPAV